MTSEFERKNRYSILEAAGDYTLIDRNTSFQTFVVCWLFDTKSYTWAQGHYFYYNRAGASHWPSYRLVPARNEFLLII